MISESEPSREEIQTALNVVVRDMLCPGAALVAAAHLCYVLTHLIIQPPQSRGVMMALDGATALIALGLSIYFAKVKVPASRAHLFGGLMIAIVLIDFGIQTYVVSKPALPVYLLVGVVASGCFLLSWGWLIAAILGSVAVWSIGILAHPADQGWRYAHFMLVGVMVGLLTHWIRRKTYGDYERVKFQLRRATRQLEERLKAEQILTRVSTRLLTLLPDEIDRTLVLAMEAVGEWLGIDHVCVCRAEGTPPTLHMIQEWCGPDVTPRKAKMQNVHATVLPWCWQQFALDKHVQIRRLEDLGSDAQVDKAYLEQMGICSFFAVPLVTYGRIWGLLGLASERQEIPWAEDTARLLRILGEIILAAVHRQEAEGEISHLNRQLEQASRLVGLGEMAANLAHDLGNGLSSILQFTQGASRRAERGSLTLEKCCECIDDIQEQAEHMGNILRMILQFVKTRKCDKARIPLGDIIEQAELLVRGKLQQKSVRRTFHPPQGNADPMGRSLAVDHRARESDAECGPGDGQDATGTPRNRHLGREPISGLRGGVL